MASTHRVLVPFDLPDADPLPAALVDALAAADVVVLGRFELPEQTPPAIARDQFGDDATAELDALAADFEGRVRSVETRLVFDPASVDTAGRVAVEESCDVVLTAGPVDAVERVLLPLRGPANVGRIVAFAADLLEATGASIALFHATEADDRVPGEELLADASDRLVAAGVDPDRIDRRLGTGDAGTRIVEAGDEYDALVPGETEPSLRERIFGDRLTAVTGETEDPTFVVRDADPA
jgi:nucleotide-binding universal stress UspA family protein